MKTALNLLIASFFLGAAIFLATAKTKKNYSPLSSEILSDLDRMKIQAFFPESVDDLKQIRLLFHTKDQNLKNQLHKLIHLPFIVKNDAKHALQVDVIPNLEPEEEAQIILQFNIFEVKSQNKIWEGSRLYKLTKSEVAELIQTKKNPTKSP